MTINSDYQIYFHIGYPKCGSTSLQENLFSGHSEINHFGKENTNFKYFYSKLKHRKYYDAEIRSDLIKSKLLFSKINVFSDEGLSNQFYSTVIDNYSKALKIKNNFPNAKIIIVIRNQADLLRSFYDFSIPDESLNKWLQTEFAQYQKISSDDHFLDSLKFDKIIAYYQSLFGLNNVLVLLFEDLKYNPKQFANKLSTFLNISEQETIIAMNQSIKKNHTDFINRKRLLQLRKKIFPKNISVSQYLPNFIFKIIQYIFAVYSNKKPQKSNISSKNLKKIYEFYSTSDTILPKISDITLENLITYKYPLSKF